MKDDYLVTGSWDCYMKIWKCSDLNMLNMRNMLVECMAVDDKVLNIDLIIDLKTLTIAAGLKSGEIIIWSFCTSQYQTKSFRKIFDHQNECDSIKYNANGSILASCSSRKVKLFCLFCNF